MANVRISDLTVATAATSAMQIEVNDAGVSKSVTAGLVAGFNTPVVTDVAQTLTSTQKTQGITNLGAVGAPSTATDGALVLFDGTTGRLVKGSVVLSTYAATLLDDADAVTARATLGAEPSGQVFGINTQGTSYTLVLADAGKVIEINSGSAVNLTIPTNAAVAFPVGARIDVVQYGAGQVTVSSSATLRSNGGKFKLTGQYSCASLYKRATDEWVLAGDLST